MRADSHIRGQARVTLTQATGLPGGTCRFRSCRWFMAVAMVLLVFGPAMAEEPAIVVSGVVTRAGGTAVEDVTVFLCPVGIRPGVVWSRVIADPCQTDEAGRFTFSMPVPDELPAFERGVERGDFGIGLLAWSPRWGWASTTARTLRPSEEISLVLQPGVMATGVVLNEAGRPVPGAAVRATNALRFSGHVCSPVSVTTDKDGIFEFGGLPVNRFVGLVAESAEYSDAHVTIQTRVAPRDPDDDQDEMEVLEAFTTVTVQKKQPLSIRVVDHAGQPVSGGSVFIQQERRTIEVSPKGMAELDLRPHAGRQQLDLRYSSGLASSLPNQVLTIDADSWPDAERRRVEIRLPRPVWLTGRVVDGTTGQPLSRVSVHYGEGTVRTRNARTASVLTQEDGSFRIAAATGPGRLSLTNVPAGYFNPRYDLVPREFPEYVAVDVPQTGSVEPVTIGVGHGLMIRGRLQTHDGQPVSGQIVRIESPGLRHDWGTFVTMNAAGEFELQGLSPFAEIVMTAFNEAGGMIQSITAVEGSDWSRDYTRTVNLTIDPAVALIGRVIHKDQPAVDAVVRLHVTHPEDHSRTYQVREMRTDSSGAYRFPGLQRGQGYRVEIDPIDELTVKGWRHDDPPLPEIAADESRREITLPDAWVVEHGQTLKGQVVDDLGAPVEDAAVQVRWMNGRRFTTSDGNSITLTDQDGFFKLKRLPNMPLKLTAVTYVPESTEEPRTATVQPKRNQSDIVIEVDLSEQ